MPVHGNMEAFWLCARDIVGDEWTIDDGLLETRLMFDIVTHLGNILILLFH